MTIELERASNCEAWQRAVADARHDMAALTHLLEATSYALAGRDLETQEQLERLTERIATRLR